MRSNIVLIGPSGSGKSTVGRRLADRLGLAFVDLDRLIEATAGRPIPEIFRQQGEASFRELEASLTQIVSELNGVVIATGGGAWIFAQNRQRLRENGVSVYLTAPVAELWSRLQGSPEERPLLQGGPEALKSQLREREPHYQQAGVTVDTGGKSVETVCEEILARLGLEGAAGDSVQEKQLGVNTGDTSYPIVTGSGLLARVGELCRKELDTRDRLPRLFAVSDTLVHHLFGEVVAGSLHEAGFELEWFVIPPGERSKSLDWAEKAYLALSRKGFDRGDAVLALGGGVVGDLAGFVAATYMRGINVVQVPTTLLAQVDSSVGGKTAVNLPSGKNLVGAFHQPRLVVADVAALRHLSDTSWRQGLGECIKYGLIRDRSLYELLEQRCLAVRSDWELLQEVVYRCCRIKGEIVRADVQDRGERMLLNAGHTIGHALEKAAGYRHIAHGEAVALGLLGEMQLSKDKGMLSSRELARLEKLLSAFGFPDRVEGSFPAVEAALRRDKKTFRGRLRMPLITGIGSARIIDDVQVEDLLPYCRRFVTCPNS